MIKEYIKKPVKIKAVQLEKTMSSIQECYEFMKQYKHSEYKMAQEMWYMYLENVMKSEGITIHTLEGDHLASWGDYIIEGIEGNFIHANQIYSKKLTER